MRYLIIVLSLLFLTGCASTPNHASSEGKSKQEKTKETVKETADHLFYFLVRPDIF